MPRSFKTIPEAWKHFMRQAPAEHGGEWWYITPFNQTPWIAGGPAQVGCNKPGFLTIRGPRPTSRGAAQDKWDQDCKYFKQVGLPEGFKQSEADTASATFTGWDMGKVVFYEGRYGWRATFPDSKLDDFEALPEEAIERPDLTIARYQTRLLEMGVVIPRDRIHPYVPPILIPEGAAGNPT